MISTDDEEQEGDPRDELIRRLLAYKQYKEVANELRIYEDLGLKSFFKPQEDLSQFEEDQIEIETFDVDSLFKTLNKILNRRVLNSDVLIFEEISRDEFTIMDCTKTILQKLELTKQIKFSQLLNNNSSRNEIVAYFLSLLELMRFKNIFVSQDDVFSDLIIIKNDIGAN